MRRVVAGLLLLALLACGEEDAKDTGDGPHTVSVPDWDSYVGTFAFTLAGRGADTPGCDLRYAFEGKPADIACDDCEFAFNLEFTYEPDESVNTWSCLDNEETADFSWTLGYDANLYGYDIGVFWLYHPQGAYWSLGFYTALDGDTLSFHNDYYSLAYYYDYYDYSFDGIGTVTADPG